MIYFVVRITLKKETLHNYRNQEGIYFRGKTNQTMRGVDIKIADCSYILLRPSFLTRFTDGRSIIGPLAHFLC